MNKTRLIILLLSLYFNSAVNSQAIVDSLVNEICQTITKDTTSNDSIRLFSGFISHMTSYAEDNPSNNTEDFWSTVFLRLQVKCNEFIKLSIRLNKYNEHWQIVFEKPVASISESDCAKFYKIKRYKYLEPTGDTTILMVNKSYWMDLLNDGTYSKLKLTKKTICDFELTFIESNNLIKNKLSQPGDKYFYTLIERTDKYYLLCVETRVANIFTLFKVYYK